jgi:hypothetical protein
MLCGQDALKSAVAVLTPAKFRELNLEALSAGYEMANALAA